MTMFCDFHTYENQFKIADYLYTAMQWVLISNNFEEGLQTKRA